MQVFRLHPEYTASEDYYAHSIDDDCLLMKLPQRKLGSVARSWPPGLRFRISEYGAVADVLFNPDAFICSDAFRRDVSDVCGDDAEWLPVQIESIGEMYVFHPIHAVPLGTGAVFRQHHPGDNIVEIKQFVFDCPETLPSCFLIAQPPESPAGRAGFACAGTYVTDSQRLKMRKYRGIDFACVYDSKQRQFQ